MSTSDRDVRQVIVVRKDLNMPAGKLGAQVAHASLGALFKSSRIGGFGNKLKMIIDLITGTPEEVWINGRFVKIVVEVENEEELLKVLRKAEKKGLKTALIQDAGFTVFDKPTVTCLGIGPAPKKSFNGVTNHLRLYGEGDG